MIHLQILHTPAICEGSYSCRAVLKIWIQWSTKNVSLLSGVLPLYYPSLFGKHEWTRKQNTVHRSLCLHLYQLGSNDGFIHQVTQAFSLWNGVHLHVLKIYVKAYVYAHAVISHLLTA